MRAFGVLTFYSSRLLAHDHLLGVIDLLHRPNQASLSISAHLGCLVLSSRVWTLAALSARRTLTRSAIFTDIPSDRVTQKCLSHEFTTSTLLVWYFWRSVSGNLLSNWKRTCSPMPIRA